MFHFYLRACVRATLVASTLLAAAAYAAPGPSPVSEKLSPRELVREVLRHNQGIAAMQAAVDAARAQIESAGALGDPMLSYSMAPGTLGPQAEAFGQSIKISQSFPWPGTLDLRTGAAKAEARSATQQLADLRLQLAAQARAAYAQWYYVHRALAVNKQNQALIQHLRKIAGSAYANGKGSQQDVLQAEVELTRLKNQALELERRRHTVRAKINRLVDQPPRRSLPPPADLPPPRDLPAFAGLRATALDRYPVLKSLDAQIAASHARVDLAEKDSYPTFTVMAGYNSMWAQPAMRPMVGVGINIPFGGNHEGEIDAAHAKLRQSRAKLADARSQLLSRLDQAYAMATQARHTIRLYSKKLLPLAKQNLQAAENDYRNGSGDFLTLVNAERQYLMAKLERAQARANFFTQLAALNYRTGGALFPEAPAARVQDPLP
ncbi:MAG TPA: TolC family protein [Gammaproteobacteria bacterium]|nr:TolC family protein [Gammaproteobacteria bacterium]